MKINKKKLGFTLVELLVVIAILAVLATVAIIGYGSFIQEAHKSNDNGVVTELNHYLKAANPLDEAVPTATDAAEKVEDSGLNIAKLQPSAKDAYYGYDYEKKEFVYIEKENVSKNDMHLTTFLFVKNSAQRDFADEYNYSIYLQKGFQYNGVFNAKYGLDVGEATISDVNYTSTSSNTVVIRTNGGTLTINAESGSVKHYGEATYLDIKAVYNSSYHEYGYVPYAQISKGRIVNEAGSIEIKDGSVKQTGVENLFIVAETEGSGNTAGSFNEVIVEAKQGAAVPSLDRSNVNIVGEVLVVEVKTPNSDDFVYLTKAGIIEQVVVTSQKGNTDTSTSSATYGTDTTLNNASSKAANEIANIAQRGENGRPLKEDGVTEMTVEEVTNLESVEEIKVEAKASSDDIATGTTQFAGGAGVATNPYLISTVEQFEKLSLINYAGKTFALTKDITIDVKDFTSSKSYITNFNGTFAGNNNQIIITNVNSTTETDFSIFNNAQGNFKDFIIVNNANTLVSISSGKDRTPSNKQLTSLSFVNVDYGYKGVNKSINLSNNNCGLYTQNGVDNVSFKDCDVYYDLNSTAQYVGIFVGGRVNTNHKDDTTLYFENCNYYGSAFAGGAFGILIGNNNNNRTSENVTIKNCANYGSVLGFGIVGFITTGDVQAETKLDGLNNFYASHLKNFGTINQLADDGTDVTIQGYPNGQYVITKGSNDVDYYEFRFHESLPFYDSNTGTEEDGPWGDDLSFKIKIRINSSDLTFVNSTAESGLHVSSYTTYDYWKSHYNNDMEYTGVWAQTDEKVPYFYDAQHKCFAINLNSYANQYRIAHDIGDNYKVSPTHTGIANMTMFAYKDGEIVAYVNLGAAWGSN